MNRLSLETRLACTVMVAGAHLVHVVLWAVDRLSFTVATRVELIETMLRNAIWVPLHTISIVWVIAALLRRKGVATPVGLATGVLVARGLLGLAWGITAVRPVSLGGPCMTLVVAGIAFFLTSAWSVAEGKTGAR